MGESCCGHKHEEEVQAQTSENHEAESCCAVNNEAEACEIPNGENATDTEATEASNSDAENNSNVVDFQKEADLWKDKALRVAAEMENLRKRTAKEIDDARKYGVTSFARELLAVQDNLERAMTAMHESEVEKEALEPILAGVQMVKEQLAGSFGKVQIERVTALGEKLNPELHQAMMEVPSEDGQEVGTIVQELQAGYTIAGRLLRPALVAVAK